MLSVYFDESGTHQNSRICAIGGLVASPAQWERLSLAWQRVLNDVGLTDFHASDCATGKGVFHRKNGWDQKDREELYTRLVNLTVKMVAFRAWTAVVMDDYHLVFSDSREKLPYSICATCCASRLRWIAGKRGPDFRISYVFDQGPKGGKIFASFDKMINKGEGSFYQIGSISKGCRVKMLPLQAADLHVYEVYRYFSDQMKYGNSTPMRKWFWELLKISDGNGGGYLLTKNKLELLSHGIVRQKLLEGKRDQVVDVPLDRLDREHAIKLQPALLPTTPPGSTASE